MTNAYNLPLIQSGYSNVVTNVLGVGSFQRVITANPNRWALTFIAGTNLVSVFPFGSLPNGFTGIQITPGAMQLWKFKDNPVITTAEWGANIVAGQRLVVIEEIFTG